MTAALFDATPRYAPASRVRLTRRGRRVVATALVLFVASVVAVISFALGVLSSGSVAASDSQPGELSTTSVVVHSGQTLWQIAQQVNPTGDPRATLEQISVLNGMGTDVTLRAGQVLLVPVIK